MVTFPNAKINLGLRVLRKRQDGFHDIESIFYPIPWRDILDIVPSDYFSFQSTGLPIPGNPESNLCVKAYERIMAKYGIGPVKIHLHKQIPMGAGLGGGSADAAFTLLLLNRLYSLGLSVRGLEEHASALGSDCAFFISNRAAWVTGRGEKLDPVNLSLSGLWILVIYPGIEVPTVEAFRAVSPQELGDQLMDIPDRPLEDWRNICINDFEPYVFQKYPQVKRLKDELYEKGAVFASMSGSGSAVYGVFEEEPNDAWMKHWIQSGYSIKMAQL